jgi:hypothetical protein
MARRAAAALIVVVLLLALGAIAAACGDDDLTLEGYFQRLDAVEDAGDEAGDRLREEWDEAARDLEFGEERLDVSRGFWKASAAFDHRLFEKREGIEPPPEVEDAHEEMLAAEADVLVFADDWVKRYLLIEFTSDSSDLTSELQELQNEWFEPAYMDILDRRLEAWCALKAIADDNGIDVDLECREDPWPDLPETGTPPPSRS